MSTLRDYCSGSLMHAGVAAFSAEHMLGRIACTLQTSLKDCSEQGRPMNVCNDTDCCTEQHAKCPFDVIMLTAYLMMHEVLQQAHQTATWASFCGSGLSKLHLSAQSMLQA